MSINTYLNNIDELNRKVSRAICVLCKLRPFVTSELHCHNTRYAKHGNFYVSSVRTSRFGLKYLKIEGAKLWENIPNNIKDIRF